MSNKCKFQINSASEDFSALEAWIAKLEDTNTKIEWQFSDNTNLELLRDQINALKALAKDQADIIYQLENRVVCTGVQMDDFVFQSFEDNKGTHSSWTVWVDCGRTLLSGIFHVGPSHPY